MRGARKLLVLLFLLASCGSDDAPSDHHEISGSVTDARTNAPVAQALVSFESDALDHAEATTDSSGHFSMQVDVRAGVDLGTVRASHDGYDPSVAQSVYFDEQPHVLSLQLVPKESTSKTTR